LSLHYCDRRDEAMKLLERTLDIQRRTLGEDHPDTLAAASRRV
jgi:hypothetical protein